jgi:hypothetical protein
MRSLSKGRIWTTSRPPISVKEGDAWSGWVDEFTNVRRGYLPTD